jgi:hypothetical protein
MDYRPGVDGDGEVELAARRTKHQNVPGQDRTARRLQAKRVDDLGDTKHPAHPQGIAVGKRIRSPYRGGKHAYAVQSAMRIAAVEPEWRSDQSAGARCQLLAGHDTGPG